MDKIREEFEEWWKSEYGAPLSDFNELWCAEGGYCDEDLDRQWEAWEASRASIVVELPKGITTREALNLGYMGDYAVGVDDGIEESAKVIRSIGLSIKGE
ncbi:hypothetical protein [Serratia marcescens]|uniref:hypothetical protein n=1 Tax=Serratia marcescens TaxID=615 RepID=UPI00074560D5|nr:hypothetical protein [Serratia marcescens]CVB31039.1 Uncharacterised protein [Serratia marcescens]CVB84276.1 Uncharacterised protein [Serratia marcescens]CVF87173.1 Uncharacterised protein [Serratia marcescens]CVG58171.1 Uncharacterised protein [Serratia marcescens]